MDRDEIRRLADVMAAAVEVTSGVPFDWYQDVWNAADGAIGDSSLAHVMPPHPAKAGRSENVAHGALFLRAGAAYLRGLAATGAGESHRDLAATDLLGQVHQLLEDDDVHPAAPIVLAAAALEEVLRDRVESSGLSIDGKPSLFTYAASMRRARILSEPERTAIEWVAKLRNDAAHGRFDDLDPAQAPLVASQVNLLLSKLGGADSGPGGNSEA